ncbi:ornithine decarboxylase [Artomyces pyxidatus]|uniref:Ornithine decarboxylase n=1 Tax=Artomyces pyxidatus TaxID=48021 RepID=A0ACB8T824_9AGAM|nr:ornithine decarboxylase [Artomyces pyxidatus]
MSQLEILPAALDFFASSSPTSSNHLEKLTSWTSNLLLLPNGGHTATDVDDGDDDFIFPDLPPLLRGHPEVHLRNGVLTAARLAAVHEPDAEKAYFVADLSYVYKQHERWKRCLPDIEPFYAIKCNPDPYVLRLLSALGTGFDCASNGEIAQVLRLGVAPDRIIFANPCKATSFIKNAAKSGVDMMTFDNADELYKVARANPAAKLVLRILTDDTKSLCRLGLKFGAPLVTVPGLLAKAKELDLDVIGISFHVGSGCYDSSAFSDAVMRARAAFDMGAEAGYEFKLLDVGGGFEDANFEATAAILRDAIAFYFPDRHGLRVIAEPGRYFVARAFSLAANVIARRAPLTELTEADAGPQDIAGQPTVMYYINDGVYGAFNCILFDHQQVHPYVLAMNGSFHISASEPLRTSSVWGPTCDSIDCVCPVTDLPAALQVGDWLAFDNMGAYTKCAASQFNGFEVSSVIYTTGGGAGSIETRRALKAVAGA